MAERIWPSPAGAEVPAWLLKRPEASVGSKLLYGRLATLGREHGLAGVTLKALGADTGLAPGEVEGHLASLVDLGLIEVEGKTDAEGQLTVWFLRHQWQELPGKGRPRATNTHKIDFRGSSRDARTENKTLDLFQEEKEEFRGVRNEPDHAAIQKANSSSSKEKTARPRVRTHEELPAPTGPVPFLGSDGTAPPSRSLDPYARFQRSELPLDVPDATSALEAIWRQGQERHDPTTRAAPWGHQERTLIRTLRSRYTHPECEALLRYVIDAWPELRGRFRDLASRPVLLWVSRMHETLMQEVTSRAPHAATLREWETWQEAHRNDISAEPPTELAQRVELARAALAKPARR